MENIRPVNIVKNNFLISQIQQQLLKDDAFIPGKTNQDNKDLAKIATITANHEQIDGPAINIISGQNRSVHGKRGVRSDLAIVGTHRWMSDPSAGFPAIIELNWEAPKYIRHLQIIFDTGSHRVLTFSLADEYTRKMHWGKPQPETVKDYCIETTIKGQPAETISETNNYQRLRRHELKGVPVDRIQITVLATHGIDHARIFEIRAYE
jgi:hypothetical protein